MMTVMRQNHKQLTRVGKLLSLGQSINEQFDNDAPCFPKKEKEPADTIGNRINTQSLELYRLLITDMAMRPIKNILVGAFQKSTNIEQLWILALVAYGMTDFVDRRETADTIATKAGLLFHDDRITGMLKARQVVAYLIEHKVLHLKDDAIIVCNEIRHWMACDNRFAAFDLTEREAEYYRNKATEKVWTGNHSSTSDSQLKSRVESIPLLKPQEIYDEIGNQGYIGQDNARKVISLAAYRHITRLKRIFVDGLSPKELPPRENALLIGATGTGKSFLIKTLFENIFKIPTAINDACSISDVGFVGMDVSILLTKLMEAANGDKHFAQLGVSCIDEFDKVAGRSNSYFGGESASNDVSRGGVQRGLLKLFEEDSVVEIPSQSGKPINRGSISFSTSNVLFIACGAFSGMDLITKTKPSIGFSENHSVDQQHDISRLTKFGIARELVGRFGSIVIFEPLTPPQLMEILEKNTIRRYARELELSGIQLKIDADVKERIVQQAIARRTGARGLASELMTLLNDACFAAYSSPTPAKDIRIFKSGYSIGWDIGTSQPRKRKIVRHS